MRLSSRFWLYFSAIQLVIIITALISFWLLYSNKKTSPSSLFIPHTSAPTATPDIVNVKNENQLAETGFLGTYLLFVGCPPKYGVRGIHCSPSQASNDTLNSITKNVPGIDTFGAVCSYKASSGFRGTIEAICDKNLFGIPVYNSSNFSPGVNSSIPDVFEIWQKARTEKITENQYSIKLSCPLGYSASDVTCDEYLQDITSPSELLSPKVLTEGDNSIGECQYHSSNPTQVTIRLNCHKGH